MKLEWKIEALSDRERIMDFIALDKPQAAFELDSLFEKTADNLKDRLKLFKPGRMKGTIEAIVHPNYVLVYTVSSEIVTILRVLHSSQVWPA